MKSEGMMMVFMMLLVATSVAFAGTGATAYTTSAIADGGAEAPDDWLVLDTGEGGVGAPSINPSDDDGTGTRPVFEGALDEGRTTTYRWDNRYYEITLVWVTFNDIERVGDANSAIAERGFAKFAINGELTRTMMAGEKDETVCGAIVVEKVSRLSTSNYGEKDAERGRAYFTFYPYACATGGGSGGGSADIDHELTDTLAEGETRTYTLMGKDLEVSIKEVADGAGCTPAEGDGDSACAESDYLGRYAAVAINQRVFKVKEGQSASVIDGNFKTTFTAKEISLPTGVAIDASEKRVTFHMEAQMSAPNPAGCDADDCYEYTKPIIGIEDEPVACSDDAKRCPDGSYVGRTGKECAFAPCPGEKPTPVEMMDEECDGQWVCRGEGRTDCVCYRTNMPYPDDTAYGEDTTGSEGCVVDGRRVATGIRVANGEARYCDYDGQLREQNRDGVACQNSFECVSNQCYNGVCKSLDRDIEESKGLLQKIAGWFKGIFG